MRRFNGRVALVTGAAQGIGRAVALRLASEAAAVMVTDLRADGAEAVAEELIESGADALAAELDVTSGDSIRNAMAVTLERFGRLDVLVNNAGRLLTDTRFEELDADDWHRQLDVTLVGVAECIRAALPHLSATRGNVVTVGSMTGLAAFGNVEYAAGKAGVQILSQNLALEYGPRGIRFNVVAPGTVATAFLASQPGRLEELATMYPLGRIGQPDDVAAAVAFLASDDASWITGVTLPVEGGVLTGRRT